MAGDDDGVSSSSSEAVRYSSVGGESDKDAAFATRESDQDAAFAIEESNPGLAKDDKNLKTPNQDDKKLETTNKDDIEIDDNQRNAFGNIYNEFRKRNIDEGAMYASSHEIGRMFDGLYDEFQDIHDSKDQDRIDKYNKRYNEIYHDVCELPQLETKTKGNKKDFIENGKVCGTEHKTPKGNQYTFNHENCGQEHSITIPHKYGGSADTLTFVKTPVYDENNAEKTDANGNPMFEMVLDTSNIIAPIEDFLKKTNLDKDWLADQMKKSKNHALQQQGQSMQENDAFNARNSAASSMTASNVGVNKALQKSSTADVADNPTQALVGPGATPTNQKSTNATVYRRN